MRKKSFERETSVNKRLHNERELVAMKSNRGCGKHPSRQMHNYLPPKWKESVVRDYSAGPLILDDSNYNVSAYNCRLK